MRDIGSPVSGANVVTFPMMFSDGSTTEQSEMPDVAETIGLGDVSRCFSGRVDYLLSGCNRDV